MLTLAAADTLAGVASAGTIVTSTIFGMELAAGVETYKVLDQRQLAAAAATIYTVPTSTTAFIRSITVVNNDSVTRTFQYFRGGTAAANAITPVITLPIGGMAIYEDGQGWTVYDSTGRSQAQGLTISSATPSVTDAGAGTAGTSLQVSASDHDHQVSVATNAILLGTAAAAGAATSTLRSNDTIAAFDATTPQAASPGVASATGSVAFAARRDHIHQESGGIVSLTAATSGINTTETVIKNFSIPANLMIVGTTFRITGHGICTTTVANLVTIRCRIGTTTLTGNIPCTLTATGTTTGVAAPFAVDMLITVRSNGASGTAIGNGCLLGGTESAALTAWSRSVNLSATAATVVVDTTATKLIELTCVTAATTTTLTWHDAAIDWVKI